MMLNSLAMTRPLGLFKLNFINEERDDVIEEVFLGETTYYNNQAKGIRQVLSSGKWRFIIEVKETGHRISPIQPF